MAVSDIAYYPGCTLKNRGAPLEAAFLAFLDRLGISIPELERWNCCGTVFSLAQDSIIHHVATLRNLIRAKQMKRSAIVAPCSICSNTKKQVVAFLKEHPDLKERLDRFLEDEGTRFEFDVRVLDLIEFLRDEIGYDTIQKKAHSLGGVRVGVYYGCLHSRPRITATGAVENPQDIETLLEKLGVEVVDFAFKTDCCGSYLRVKDESVASERVARIVASATANGAQVLLTLCPLCHHNLDTLQTQVPVLYLPQLLAMALGVEGDRLLFEQHAIDPRPVLSALSR